MKNEPSQINVFHDGLLLTFGPPLSFGALATLLRQGRRLESFIPDDKWNEIASTHSSRFNCVFCSAPVLAFYDANKRGECTEFCRCTALWCIDKEHLVKTPEEWSEWQADYIKEMADPTPFNALIEGQLVGTLDKLSSDWLSRHVGTPEGILWHTDGSISSGDASVSFTLSSLLATVDHDHLENNEKIVEVLHNMQRDGLAPPETLENFSTSTPSSEPRGRSRQPKGEVTSHQGELTKEQAAHLVAAIGDYFIIEAEPGIADELGASVKENLVTLFTENLPGFPLSIEIKNL